MAIPCGVLRQTITVEPYLGEGGIGGPVFGPPVAARARVEGRRRTIRRSDGTAAVSTATAIVLPDLDVDTEARVVADGRSYEVAEVITHRGMTCVSHRELVLADLRTS